MLWYFGPDNLLPRTGSYMSITIEDKRIGRNVERRERLEANRRLQSTLMPRLGDNDYLREVLLQLRSATAPKDVAPCRRKVEVEVEPLSLYFYAKQAEDFVSGSGGVSPRKARASARVFAFESNVTVTRQSQGGRFFYTLTDGRRSLSIGERRTPQIGLEYSVLRVGGFADPTGRTAGQRSRGCGPGVGPER